MITKTDYELVALVGFLVGVFAIPTFYNLGLRQPMALLALPIVVPPLWIFGVRLGDFLSRWVSFSAQFSKFAAVGFLNTAIDFGVLNLFILTIGINNIFFIRSEILGIINVPGFIFAVSNSYLWNKLWVFRNNEKEGLFEDLPRFLVVTSFGLLLNSLILISARGYAAPLFPNNAGVVLNIAKATATAVVLFWNFLGYKFLVFGSQSRN